MPHHSPLVGTAAAWAKSHSPLRTREKPGRSPIAPAFATRRSRKVDILFNAAATHICWHKHKE